MMSLKCEICENNPHKYKCPRCSYKTCSLVCCNKHKETMNCTGMRDKTKFLKKDEFNEMALLSDYRFLEESSNIIDAAQRQTINPNSSIIPNSTAYNGFFENLRKFVHSEFEITLNLMPNQASRHLANKTRFNRNSKVVSWSIELIFHLSNNSPNSNLIKLNTKKNLFSSKETLRSILNSFYEKYKSDLFEPSSHKTKVETDSSQNFLALYTEFDPIFKTENFTNINILLPVTDFEKKKKFYVKLDLNETLENSIRKRTLLEYPTFYIVKDEQMSSYRLEKDIEETTSKNSMKNEISESGSHILKDANDLEDGEYNTSESQDSDESLVNSNKRPIDLDTDQTSKKSKTIKTEDGELSD